MAETAEQKAEREKLEKSEAANREAEQQERAKLNTTDAKAKVAQAEEDQKASDARENNVTTTNPRAPDAVAEQHRQVDEAKAKLNDHNREGHERNMERIAAEANEAQARTEHADDHRAGHVPTGKQDNRNTPIVNKDGSKTWV